MPTSWSISIARCRAPRVARLFWCSRIGLGDLLADRVDRVQRGHRLLEDHRDLVAADRAHLALGELEQILARRRAPRPFDAPGRMRDEPHDRERGHALAAARFADDAERAALGDVERDAVDRAQRRRASVRNAVTRLRTASRFGNCPRGEGIRHRMYTSSLGPRPPEIPVE